jgi:hypothetical protein
MPQPRKYATRSLQQAAYRERQAHAVEDLLTQKGLPALPAIPTLPGHHRWSAMICQAHSLLQSAAKEIQNYHDERSEAWQEGERAEALLARLELIQESIDTLREATLA